MVDAVRCRAGRRPSSTTTAPRTSTPGPSRSARCASSRCSAPRMLDGFGGTGDLAMGAVQTWGTLVRRRQLRRLGARRHARVLALQPGRDTHPRRALRRPRRATAASTVVTVAPDYSPSAIHASLWVNPRPGTDAALALGIARALLERDAVDAAYVREQTDLPFLVRDDTGRFLRQADLEDGGARRRLLRLRRGDRGDRRGAGHARAAERLARARRARAGARRETLQVRRARATVTVRPGAWSGCASDSPRTIPSTSPRSSRASRPAMQARLAELLRGLAPHADLRVVGLEQGVPRRPAPARADPALGAARPARPHGLGRALRGVAPLRGRRDARCRAAAVVAPAPGAARLHAAAARDGGRRSRTRLARG